MGVRQRHSFYLYLLFSNICGRLDGNISKVLGDTSLGDNETNTGRSTYIP